VLALLALPGIQAYFTNHREEERMCGGDGGREELQELNIVRPLPQLRFFYCKTFTIINVFLLLFF
jgi:hypothetical protein